MKNRRILSTIIVLLIGIFISFAIFISIGAFLSYKDSDTLLKEPKKFGDIRIWAGKPSDVGCTPNPEIDEMLVMEKDNIPFLEIHKNKAGQISGLYLIKNATNGPIFFMTPLKAPGKWGRATYSRGSGTGHPVGDVFVDIDFDGRFDFRMVMDDSGKPISRFIFVDRAWLDVVRCSLDKMIAATEQINFIFIDGDWQKVEHWSDDYTRSTLGETKYSFDPNSGWHREQ